MKYYKKKRNTRKPYKTRKFNSRIKAVIKSKKIPALFPLTKQCRLVYKNPSTTISSGGLTSYTSQVFACNNCNDFDYSNNLGNKSPLYWDYLCTAQGPYKKFRVNAWKTTLKVINLSDKALNVYFDHGTLGAVTDADTPQEMQNR